MKHPLQALLVSPSRYLRTAIVSGAQTASIREGHRDYRPGPVMLCCQIVPWCVMADIVEVRHCTLREVAKKEWQACGFSSKVDMTEGLRRYYKDLTLDSPVTVVRWKDARGYLIDHAEDYASDPAVLYAGIAHD